jgi:lipoate-protein ligase B
MLLKEYLLLNLGRVIAAEAQSWRETMETRRRADASRDLLAFWRPRVVEAGARPGQLMAIPVLSLHRFMGEVTPAHFKDGLLSVAQRALADFAITAEPRVAKAGLWVENRAICSIATEVHKDVGSGLLMIEVNTDRRPNAVTMAELLGREVDTNAVANAVAYRFEEAFGYQQAAQHPVAYEESMRSE